MKQTGFEQLINEERARIAQALGAHQPWQFDAAERAVALVVLCQGLPLHQSEMTLVELVEIAVDSANRKFARTKLSRRDYSTIVDGLRSLYGNGENIRPIEPDSLGQEFMLKILGQDPTMLATLLDRRREAAYPALRVLSRASSASAIATRVRSILEAILPDRLELLAIPLLTATHAEEGALQDIANAILHDLPEQKRARTGAAIVSAAAQLLNINSIPVRLRAFLGNAANFAARLEQSGMDEAQNAEALVSQSHALVDQSAFLLNAGRRSDALWASERAVRRMRSVNAISPGTYLADFASSLESYGTMLSSMAKYGKAFEMTAEATDIRRRLAIANRDLGLPDLAISLNNLSIRHANLGRRTEALNAIQESVALRRELAEKNPDRYLPSLASSLSNLNVRLIELGKREDAVRAGSQAVEIYRKLARTRPDEYEPDLAMALSNLSRNMSDFGLREEAVQLIEESINIRYTLVSLNRLAFLPDLAMSLNNYGLYLTLLGRRTKALAATEQAVAFYRELSGEDRETFKADLAMALVNLGGDLFGVGLFEKSLAAFAEAIAIRWDLAGANRDRFLPDIARARAAQANVLSTAGRTVEAIEAYTESSKLLRPYAKTSPAAYSGLSSAISKNLTIALKGSGKTDAEIRSTLRLLGLEEDDQNQED